MFLTTWHMTLFFYCAISNRRRNVKYKTTKLIEDYLEENLGGIGQSLFGYNTKSTIRGREKEVGPH